MNNLQPDVAPGPAAPAKSGDNPTDLSFLDMLVVTAENLRLLVVAPLAIGVVTLGITFLIPPLFTGRTVLMPPQQQSTTAELLGSLGGLAGAATSALPGLKNPADQWIGLLQSRTIADALIKRFKLRQRYEVEYMFEARQKLDARTNITSGKDGLIMIEVSDGEPKVAAELANAYVEELQKLSKIIAVGEAAQRRLFYEGQLKDIKEKLDRAQQALQAGGVSIDAVKASPDAALTAVADVQAQVAAAEVKVGVLRGFQTDNSYELRQAQLELSALRAQLTKLLASDRSRAGEGNEYIARYRDLKYYERLFELLSKQYELARSDEARQGALIQVVDAAQVPEWKSSPKRALIAAFATAVGLIGTIVYLVMRESVRNAAAEDPLAATKLKRLRRAFRRMAD
jgi:uncharacterized protein involved in exopolysaccharide biosynthesis